MTTLAQRSFSGGEVAPALYARVDTSKYTTGLRIMRNTFVMRHGGGANRPGTQFIAEVKDSTKAVRLIPFVFNSTQTYVLEFGNLYMRVHRNGAQEREAAKNITGATQANPGVVTITAHGYSNGEEVYITGVGGMVELNNRNFKVANVTANTFELQDMTGTNLDTTGYTAYTSGGTAARVYEIPTPYVEADLSTLQFVQSADLVTIAHPTYAPRELARTGHTSWTLSEISFIPTTARPKGLNLTSITAGGNTYAYTVTAIDKNSFEESLQGVNTTTVITGATKADPVVVTSTAHGVKEGDEVYIQGVIGMNEINSKEFIATNITANTIELYDHNGNSIDGTGFGTYVASGALGKTYVETTAAAAPTAADPHTINWTDSGASVGEYNVYKRSNGVFGFIGVAKGTSFDDTGIEADTTNTPPQFRNPFDSTGNYPSAVSYVQQRLCFSNTDNDTEKNWMSRIGEFKNFTTSSPLQDDDAVTFKLASRQVNEVKHLIDIGTMIVFTTSGEWAIAGDGAGIITPGNINPKQHSYNGSSSLPPIIIGNNAIYVQARGSIVRDLGFDFQSDGYRGNDLTVFSAHLFEGYTISDWAYQQIPHSIVWAVRSDGILLALTYVKEHNMVGWSRHDFEGGTVENIVSVPEGDEDRLYLVINRTINGNTTRYLERMYTRQVTASTIKDAVFMDSALTYDGRNTDTSHTMTLSGGTTWDYTETLTITSSTSYFASSDVGKELHITGADGTIIRMSIAGFTSGTVVTGKPNKTVPAAMRSAALSTWALAVNSVTGLWHLEGEDVAVFGDGFVNASPNNASYVTVTISNGVASLDQHYGVIHVGLPYYSDIETLDIDTAQGETLADKRKLISKLTLQLEKSRGVWVGNKPPSDDAVDPLENLTELKVRNDEGYDESVGLATGAYDINMVGQWNKNGRVFVRQVDPVPLSILAVSPTGWVPIRG